MSTRFRAQTGNCAGTTPSMALKLSTATNRSKQHAPGAKSIRTGNLLPTRIQIRGAKPRRPRTKATDCQPPLPTPVPAGHQRSFSTYSRVPNISAARLLNFGIFFLPTRSY